MAKGNPFLRLALIGCGRVAEQCHLPALHTLPDIKLAALVDSDGDRLNTIADRLGIDRRYSDYRAALNDPGVDVVAVCTPPHTHAEIGLAVLGAGKHLFMEKPLALSLNEADHLVERAGTSPAKSLVGFNLRSHRLVRAAHSIIADGRLGKLETVRSAFASRNGFQKRSSSWRRQRELGGSVLFDLGIHHFDLWQFLARAEIVEVFAHCRADDQAFECATVSAKMSNGVLVTGSFSHGLSDTNEIEICGQKARLQLSCYHADSLRVSEHSAPLGAVRDWLGGTVRAFRNLPHALRGLRHGGDVAASYRTQWQHFIGAIRNNTSVQCSVAEARCTLQVTLAAIESAFSGQPVKIARAAGAITPIGPTAQASHPVS